MPGTPITRVTHPVPEVTIPVPPDIYAGGDNWIVLKGDLLDIHAMLADALDIIRESL